MTSIEKFEIKHLNEVINLQVQLGYLTNTDEFHNRIKNLEKTNSFSLYVIIDDDGVSGFIAFEFLFTLQYNNPICHIMNLIVDQKKRGLGYGRFLLDKAKELAKLINSPILQLTSANIAERLYAHKFYKKYGFEKTGSRFTLKIA